MLTVTGTDRLRRAAQRVADVLVENAITGGSRSTWLGATVDGASVEPKVVHRTGDATLYEGSAGIALASWAVAAALGRDDLAETAVRAARHAVSARHRLVGAGLFDGLAGVGLVALEVGTEADDKGLVRDGLEILDEIAMATPMDADLVSGSAGVLLALLSAARRTGSARFEQAAVRHGDFLHACARQHPWGWSWPTQGQDGPDLCGLAHGASGVGWALAELAELDDRFQIGVDRARRYERGWFDSVTNSWPDLRPDLGGPGFPVPRPALWCHGAAGIGLARLRMFRLDAHPSIAAESACALQASAAESAHVGREQPAGGLTICHGVGGPVLLLLAAHSVLGEAEHLDAARWVVGGLLDHLGANPSEWPSGVRGGGFSPGLMTGLAGVMYLLARAADPTAVAALPGLGG